MYFKMFERARLVQGKIKLKNFKFDVNAKQKGKVKDLARQGAIESLNGRWPKFKHICEHGSMKLVQRFIYNRKSNLDDGLVGACYGGHKHIFQYLIFNGASPHRVGLYSACRGGNPYIVKYMMSNGVNDWNHRPQRSLSWRKYRSSFI